MTSVPPPTTDFTTTFEGGSKEGDGEGDEEAKRDEIPRGPCSLGSACTAKNQELSEQYKCRHCNRQLHGFVSGCSQAKNPKDFRDGVICRQQPCFLNASSNEAGTEGISAVAEQPDGVVSWKQMMMMMMILTCCCWEMASSKCWIM